MKIQRKELLENVKKVVPGIVTGESILEGGDSFLFTEDGIYAYNDLVAVYTPFNGGFTGAVNSKRFLTVLEKLSSEEIALVQKPEALIIKSGRSTIKVNFVESSIMKYFKGLDLENLSWNPLEDGFLSKVSTCKIASKTSPYRGIYVSGKLMYSTDGMRAARLKLTNTYGNFWLDEEAISKLVSMKTEPFLEIAITPQWVFFRSESGVIFACKANKEEEYPIKNILDIFNKMKYKEGNPKGTLPKGIASVIERAAVFSQEEKGFLRVDLTLNPELLIIETRCDAGSVKDSLEWETPLEIEEPVKVGLEASFITEASSRALSFHIKPDQHNCLVFRSQGFELVVMAMRD